MPAMVYPASRPCLAAPGRACAPRMPDNGEYLLAGTPVELRIARHCHFRIPDQAIMPCHHAGSEPLVQFPVFLASLLLQIESAGDNTCYRKSADKVFHGNTSLFISDTAGLVRQTPTAGRRSRQHATGVPQAQPGSRGCGAVEGVTAQRYPPGNSWKTLHGFPPYKRRHTYERHEPRRNAQATVGPGAAGDRPRESLPILVNIDERAILG